jgi:hypothetical protein
MADWIFFADSVCGFFPGLGRMLLTYSRSERLETDIWFLPDQLTTAQPNWSLWCMSELSAAVARGRFARQRSRP